jgi:hypothetical protein
MRVVPPFFVDNWVKKMTQEMTYCRQRTQPIHSLADGHQTIGWIIEPNELRGSRALTCKSETLQSSLPPDICHPEP